MQVCKGNENKDCGLRERLAEEGMQQTSVVDSFLIGNVHYITLTSLVDANHTIFLLYFL